MTMKHALVILTLAFLAGSRLYAQQSALSLGPEIGFFKSQDADNAKMMGGAAARYRLAEGLAVEGSVSYRSEDYNNGYVSAKSWPVMVTGLIYPIDIAYGAIGAGWYNTTIDYNYPPNYNGGLGMTSSETKQRFGWHFGGGLEMPLGNSTTLVGDIRYVFLDYNFKTFPGTNGVNSDFYIITAGVLFGL